MADPFPKDPNDVQAILTWLMRAQGVPHAEQTAEEWTAEIKKRMQPASSDGPKEKSDREE